MADDRTPDDTSAALQEASQRDAEGDHDGAINALSVGTRNGDARAARLLGLRLLTGDRAPLLPDGGLRFLGEACDGGLPEAAARAAALVALGVHTPPDWPLALRWLARSAAGGWEPARRQLRALAMQDAGPGTPAEWQALAGSIRLGEWRKSPAPVIRSDDPRVATVPGFLPAALCDVVTGFATGRLHAARVYDPVARVDLVDAHRTNTIADFGVYEVELVQVLIQARMAAACGFSERMMEPPSVLHYDPGEQIRNHYDFVDPKSTPDYAGEIERNGQRLITFIVYLNDDYDGGATEFPKLGIRHKGSRGEGIWFVNALPDLTPDLRMLHAGRPPTRGEKWIITQFVRSKAMR